jgi:hypothetical protein
VIVKFFPVFPSRLLFDIRAFYGVFPVVSDTDSEDSAAVSGRFAQLAVEVERIVSVLDLLNGSGGGIVYL